ncbi:MAG: NAD(P)H-hydrate dehydratase [Bacteroidales bacterium]|nr:NAD(P)H-hydrate dehydratase [Bacteroidales bacterium]
MTLLDASYLRPLLKPRANDSHKGDYGHLLLVCGCQTMPGAAILATGAALKSGCGLVSLHSTSLAAQAAASNFPSAMLSLDPDVCFSQLPESLLRFDAIAVGPGLGRMPKTEVALTELIGKAREAEIPLVLDADALSILARHPILLDTLPRGSVMTPHEGELRRLISWNQPEDKDEAIFALCRKSGCVVLSKGYHSSIYTPSGEKLTNTTGNPGLAKGGSGDVLTGLLGGLLARGYTAAEATALAVWIHGYAADALTERCTAEAYNSRDLIDQLYLGFKELAG